MNAPMETTLPVTAALPELAAALSHTGLAVLQAPPGAGKSTGVPLALLDAPWLAGQRMLVLEPRRLAARAVANRMASLLGENVGETVGYRMRLDTKVGPRTRIEVVTEGILTRQLQRDPALDGVALVIFDEFHERSLQADLGLALTLDVRRQLRPELRLLVMSATLDSAAVSRLLDDAPLIAAPGLSFPVETRYAERDSSDHLDRQVTAAIHRALREETGDLLVFLPGAGEIRRVESLLGGNIEAQLHPLYGDLPREAQERAIQPAADGQRKVVLATNIAETSLTIEGVRVVIDSGLERRNLFDPRSGMNRLETVPISLASAEQRRGRAGRLAPGVCYRLWTEARQRSLAAHTPPEIASADLAPLALELACWGTHDPATLAWLTPPPAGPLAQARELLQTLGALDERGRISAHGRDMHRLGTHPRLAHLLLRAQQAGVASTGCALAALLGERDVLRSRPKERDADLRTRLELLARQADAAGHPDADRQALRQVQRSAESFARQLGLRGTPADIDMHAAGWLLASAYPDRIARARTPGSGRYQLSNGRGAFFAEPQSLANSEFLAIADLDAGQREARIFTAAPLGLDEIEAHFGEAIQDSVRVYWEEREQAVLARRQRRLGELLLDDAAVRNPDPAQTAVAMLAGIRSMGLDALPWTADLRQWQARVLLARAAQPEAMPPWPDVSDATLAATLESWLLPWLEGVSRRTHLARLELRAALHGLLDWQQQQRLEEFAPTHLAVPSGSRIAIDYLDGPVPSLSVRLQEVFGLRETPRIAGGRVGVLLKLLSPARRPVQVTRDLESFWKTAYHDVRRELKGRYPKHYWPEDPHQAEPTRRARPPGQSNR
ncbi:MAG: ATP-dependent helicase HrpB [Gammaproteobacteria bacterium]|nr:ATP-dependent helicase HrpB [Gammaproteobacteria bacterium]